LVVVVVDSEFVGNVLSNNDGDLRNGCVENKVGETWEIESV
jgi:hypothetical protein